MQKKPAPQMKKIRDVSVIEIRKPPIAGRIILDPCQRIELSETALIICFLSINAGKIDERAG